MNKKDLMQILTKQNIVADMLFLKTKEINIKGKIVAISNADPGFDWIFSHNIVGLITQYGGAPTYGYQVC